MSLSWSRARAAFAAASVFLAACSSPTDSPSGAACGEGRVLQAGFYAFFEPVSYSADPNPGAEGFDEHRGYEADLLTALAAMDGAGLSFARRGIAEWSEIWLRAAGAEYDLVGGGITILDSRTRNAAGEGVVIFTSGHILFRQSLLVRAADAGRLARHGDLTSADRVGVLRLTTGEFRLLELTGFVDARGALAAGTRIETDRGEFLADGTDAHTITPAGASDHLRGRLRLVPPADDMPQVIYLDGPEGQEASELDLLAALRAGDIDAIARGDRQPRRQRRFRGGVRRHRPRRGRRAGRLRAGRRGRGAGGLHRRQARLSDRRPAHRLRGLARRSGGLPRARGAVESVNS